MWLWMVSEPLISHPVSAPGCFWVPHLRACGAGADEHSQSLGSWHQQLPEKHSEMGIGRAAAFQWEKCLFVPAEMLCSSFQTLTAAWGSVGGVWGGSNHFTSLLTPKSYWCVRAQRPERAHCKFARFFSKRSSNLGVSMLWRTRLDAPRDWTSNLWVIRAQQSQANSNPFLFVVCLEDSPLTQIHDTARFRWETASFRAWT